MGAQEERSLEALMNSWAQSPSGSRPSDGPEAPDFLNIDFLLAPSPPPPPVEDSSGSGTMGGPPLASVPMATGPAAPAHLGHEQQQHHQHQQHMLSPMEQAALHAHFGHGHGQADGQHYMLSMGSAPGSGTLPTFDPNAGMPIMPQPHSTPMLHMATQLMAQPAGTFSQPGPHPGSALVLPALTAVPADSSQQGAPSESGNGEGNGNGKRRRGPRPRVFKKHTCQSDGCTVDLAPLSFYLQRNHICTDHLKADSYQVKGVPSRFCQRCGQGHALTEFEGSKRSCRKALERHNQRRRDKQAASTATGPPPVASEPAPLPEPKLEPSLQVQQVQQSDIACPWLDDAFTLDQQQQQQALPTQPQQQQEQQEPQQQQEQQQEPPQQQQAVEEPRQQPWVMLPRHLLEQHAPHLLASSVPTSFPSSSWQLHQHFQQPPSQHQHQHQQQGGQGQDAGVLQQQPLGVDVSMSLWLGELGGSGI